jgi:hypothetical protein
VDQAFGGLLQVPLQVAGEPRAVIEHPQQHRGDPAAFAGDHLARAVVEVEVPQPMDIVGLEASHLEPRQALLGLLGSRGAPSALAPLLEKSLGFQVTA